MLCEYLQHIDLLAVYEQLPTYEPGEVKPRLANIPPQLCDALEYYFEWLAETAAEDFPGRSWQEWEPIDLAATVGDIIESEFEHLEWALEQAAETFGLSPTRAPQTITSCESLDAFLSFAGVVHVTLEPAYGSLVCLLIYQYDALCSLYQVGNFEGALSVFVAIAETQAALTHCSGVGARDWQKSREASDRAALRHAATNKQKAAALTEWDATSSDYKSRADFARIIGKRDGIKERTLYDWIAVHEKTKA